MNEINRKQPLESGSKSVRIITDSASDILDGQYPGVTVVHLSISFSDGEYLDGVDITHRQFYEKLIETDDLPRTSQPAPFAFTQAIEGVLEEEPEAEIVIVCLSSKLSGTYESALAAAAPFGERVRVVDTLSVAVGEKALVESGLRMAEAGASAAEIEAALNIEREKIHVVALLDTLEYLYKGGRISKTLAMAGGMLSMKPVVTVQDGEVALLGKARGSKRGNNLLIEEIRKAGGINFDKPLCLGYTGMGDELLKKYIQDSRALWEDHVESLPFASIGATIGTHVGPGAVAVAFFSAED